MPGLTASQAASPARFTGRAAVMMRRVVTAVVIVIAGLTFSFGFGNGWALGDQLGAPGWIAPLVAPAVDLSVVGLLAAMQYLRTNGYDGRLLGPRLLLLFSGAATLAMNTAHPIITGAYGQACFYAVAPLLLIGWSEVGPRLLASMHGTNAGPSQAVLDERADALAADLVVRARRLDAEHRETHGRPITRDRLRATLRVSNAVASDLVRVVRHPNSESTRS